MSSQQAIDAVYTWVNGADPRWQAEFHQHHTRGLAQASVHACRFRDHGELQYSLQSLEQFAPWIRQVYIVKKSYQMPDVHRLSQWLQQKIIWVDERDLCPPECDSALWAPTFNSLALEANLHRIAGLSERFIYFNNDMFLGRPLSPTYFFPEEKARLSIKHWGRWGHRVKQLEALITKPFIGGHRQHLYHAFDYFQQAANAPRSLRVAKYWQPLHQCSPLFKSSYHWIWSHPLISEQLLATSVAKFRQDNQLHSVFLCSLVQLWQGNASLEFESDAFVELGKWRYEKKMRRLLQQRPARFCVNDHARNHNTSETSQRFLTFLHDYFSKEVQS